MYNHTIQLDCTNSSKEGLDSHQTHTITLVLQSGCVSISSMSSRLPFFSFTFSFRKNARTMGIEANRAIAILLCQNLMDCKNLLNQLFQLLGFGKLQVDLFVASSPATLFFFREIGSVHFCAHDQIFHSHYNAPMYGKLEVMFVNIRHYIQK